MTTWDPDFPLYKLEPTTFDGPLVEEGAEAEVRLVVKVVEVPPAAARERGRPVMLRVTDFAGPRVDRDPGPIPRDLLEACAARVADLIMRHAMQAIEDPAPDQLATVVLEEIGRRLHPGDSDAVSLAIGVMKLDVEKLTKTGDEMAELLLPVAHMLGKPLGEVMELLATWKGQAHRDWSHLHALRRQP